MRSSAFAVVLLLTPLAAMSTTGCGGNFAGDYDGEATVHFHEPALGPELKFPVHVVVTKSSVDITGTPMAHCSPKVSDVSASRGMMLDFNGGACQVNVKGKATPLADGAGIASFKDGAMALSFNGSDVLSVTAKKR